MISKKENMIRHGKKVASRDPEEHLPLYNKVEEHCKISNFTILHIVEGSGYFAGLRMTLTKCMILNNYVAV